MTPQAFPEGTPGVRPARGRLLAAASLALAMTAAGTAAAATLLDWKDIEPSELKVEYLAVERPVTIQISTLGTVGREDSELLAYPWILDSESRKPAWQLDPRAGKQDPGRTKGGTRTIEVNAVPLQLAPGHYEIYFATFGQKHWVDASTWFWRMGKKRETRFGGLEQDPWRLKLTCADSDRNAIKIGDEAMPKFSPLARLADPPPNASMRLPFALNANSQIVVYAIGEYSDADHSLADRGWIERGPDQKIAWEMTPENTTFAGGAEKNRVFRATIDLDAGTYVLRYTSDDSHGPGDWNLNPPLDPAFWGIALFDAGGARAHFTTDVKDPITINLIVDLGKQPSDSFNMRGIHVKKSITVRVQAVGEINHSSDRFADYGWIEQARTHRTVWKMTEDNSQPAGGADKNREARTELELQPGDYLVCNWTDDSHAFGDWNAAPPNQPEAWGIRVWGAGSKFDPKSVEPYDEDKDPKILAQLEGIGDDRHATERFTLKSPAKVRILAIGEGTHGQMFDYGWIEQGSETSPTKGQGEEPEGNTLWRMRYSDTVPAGGSDKNRKEETDLELKAGTYVLHFVTDDSHSFQDWNSEPPDQPHLWGATVVRTD
jgi:hypothetical protein